MIRAALLAATCLTASGASAGCRLALALGMDVSASIDPVEHQLQRNGVADALVSPDVVGTFLTGDTVWLAVYEWSDAQGMLVDWTPIESASDLQAIATLLRTAPKPVMAVGTSLGPAIVYGGQMLARTPCANLTLDISGDEAFRVSGLTPEAARKHPDVQWITINGLAIGAQNVDGYERRVKWGPRSFVLEARDSEDVNRAMREKLITELLG